MLSEEKKKEMLSEKNDHFNPLEFEEIKSLAGRNKFLLHLKAISPEIPRYGNFRNEKRAVSSSLI